MFRSLFGKKKGRGRKPGEKPEDESIRSAGVGDVIVIPGFSPTLDDATFLVESKSRFETAFGKSYELVGVDGDRKVSIEWSEGDELTISVTEYGETIPLSDIGADPDTLNRWDDLKSTENFVEYEEQLYYYKNSYEVVYFKDEGSEGEGFWMWDFSDEDEERGISVVKWEGLPFEVYTSVAVSPHEVRVYSK